MVWFVGVDVGGTFTDFYAFDEDQQVVRIHKRPSTPEDPALAILTGLDDLARDQGVVPGDVSRFAHGTTVATNALIQRRGAPVVLITTEGFRDLLEIGRQIRPKMYDLKVDEPPPLVPRKHRIEIKERIAADGSIVEALTDDAIHKAVEAVKSTGAEACAVGLLFAFLNPEHERRIGEILKAELPDMFVSLSSAVQPVFREYERLSTTVLNAYLQPIVTRYMDSLQEGLVSRTPRAAIGINQSSGGLMSVERAGEFPIRTALSGPAAGVVGAVHIAKLAGHDDVITLDMGGTSADVALIREGKAGVGFDQKVADFPVRLPMVDVNTIGAGGGSITWFDRDGLLKVGPASAGASPGPACYNQGGADPTVSDANLVLGRLSARGLLDGKMALDPALSAGAFKPFADQLGFSLEKTAHGVLGIVCANMVRAIRAVSVERGHDPRGFALMALGGAGPLHAVDVARTLGMSTVIVPPAPGILCAQGLVVSDLKEDFVISDRICVGNDGIIAIGMHVQTLIDRAQEWFASEDIDESMRWLELVFDMRYVGQNFELAVPVADSDAMHDANFRISPDELSQSFFEFHDRAYGYHNPHDAIEAVNLRLTAWGRLNHPETKSDETCDGKPILTETRLVYFNAEASDAATVFHRANLLPGHRIAGPAVIEQLDSTTLVYPGDTATVDAALNLIIKLSA
jgi:N-methylhydantoinase A